MQPGVGTESVHSRPTVAYIRRTIGSLSGYCPAGPVAAEWSDASLTSTGSRHSRSCCYESSFPTAVDATVGLLPALGGL